MCIYIYIHIYLCVCVYIYTHTYIHTYVYTYTYTYTYYSFVFIWDRPGARGRRRDPKPARGVQLMAPDDNCNDDIPASVNRPLQTEDVATVCVVIMIIRCCYYYYHYCYLYHD